MKPSEHAGLRWSPPPINMYKLNTDIVIFKGGVMGLGFVVRNDRGVVMLAGKHEVRQMGNSTIMEGIAVLYALHTLQEYGWHSIIVETDSKNLVDSLNGVIVLDIYEDVILEDIRILANEVYCLSFHYISKQCNKAEHCIARGPIFISIDSNHGHVFRSYEQ
ncbi:hypothetical protein C2S52_020650 [Perilla frutescens var. hirtella]|nr:hypothetical protein C2S52_020650 [Perilla frutescens var. hirtella]